MLDAFLIILELQLLSYKVDKYQIVHEEPVFRIISLVLCLFFWVDMITAFILEWPRLDLLVGRTGHRFLNIVALLQHTLDLIGALAFSNARFTNMFRIVVGRFLFLRILRTTVVLPGLASLTMRQQLGELHIMIKALTGTLQPLMWCVLMYLIILIIFGAFFTEGAVSHIVRTDMNINNEVPLVRDWGTLSMSVFSLSAAMLGGTDWADLYDSLGALAFPSKAGFVAFICFTHIALLNTVTAVFIKCAFLRFEHEREFVVQQELDEKREYLMEVKRIFKDLDGDMSGCINIIELREQIKNPDVAAYFSKLGVDTDEVDKLFELMDEDGSGSINQEEFLWGCLRLKGEAKSLDLEILQRDVSFAISRILDIHTATRTQSMGTSADGHTVRRVSEQLADMQRNIQDRFARIESRFVDMSASEPTSRTVPNFRDAHEHETLFH